MKAKIAKGDWVAMFQTIGLTDAKMNEWHRLFETRHPESHQAFLEWLGLTPAEIARVRSGK